MKKEIQKQQPIYYSIIGLIMLMSWLILAYNNFEVTQQQNLNLTDNFLANLYTHFINWKLYTLICFVFGIQLFTNSELKTVIRSYLVQYAILLLALLASFISAMFLVIIPLAIFNILVLLIEHKRPNLMPIALVFIGLILALISSFGNIQIIAEPCFSSLFNYSASFNNYSNVFYMLMKPSNMIPLFYGFIIITLGFWVGKTRWLLEYHFYYNELKKLFKYSLALVIIWILLNFFDVYLFITQWKIGKVFYMLDGFSINIIIVFIYLFILVYLENFKFGKMLLKLLESSGKLWIINLVFLIATIYGFSLIQTKFSFLVYIVFSLAGFLLSTIISNFISKYFSKLTV